MPQKYTKSFKKRITELIVLRRASTSYTAREYNVPLKTVENWVTAYNKDNHCFDEDPNKKPIELDYEY